MRLAILVVIAVCLSIPFAECIGKLDHFAKQPVLAHGIRTGGRLTTRQIHALAAAGYKSYVTVAIFNTSDASFNGVDGDFPSTDAEMLLASSLGMQVFSIDADFDEPSATSISDALLRLPKPVFVHCFVGFMSSLFTLLHLVRAGALQGSEIFQAGLSLGYDYQANPSVVPFLNTMIPSLNASVAAPSIELQLTNGEQSYKTFYWPHRLGSDLWFNLGQPLSTLVNNVKAHGYKTVISFRANGEPTTRIPGYDPATGAIPNNEFSDSNGLYSIALEQAAFTAAGIAWYNLPVTGANEFSLDNFKQFLPTLEAAQAAGPVLAHCLSGYRSSAYVSTFLAYSQKQCSWWALQEAAKVGYAFDPVNDEAVISFMQQVLLC